MRKLRVLAERVPNHARELPVKPNMHPLLRAFLILSCIISIFVMLVLLATWVLGIGVYQTDPNSRVLFSVLMLVAVGGQICTVIALIPHR